MEMEALLPLLSASLLLESWNHSDVCSDSILLNLARTARLLLLMRWSSMSAKTFRLVGTRQGTHSGWMSVSVCTTGQGLGKLGCTGGAGSAALGMRELRAQGQRGVPEWAGTGGVSKACGHRVAFLPAKGGHAPDKSLSGRADAQETLLCFHGVCKSGGRSRLASASRKSSSGNRSPRRAAFQSLDWSEALLLASVIPSDSRFDLKAVQLERVIWSLVRAMYLLKGYFQNLLGNLQIWGILTAGIAVSMAGFLISISTLTK
jgi:hypothetical protein